MGTNSSASKDLLASLRAWRLWTLLGWIEVRQRYARSVLGPFWLTLSLGLMVATLGLVYGALLHLRVADYLPMLATGLVLWQLFSGIVNDGCVAYIASSGYVRQVRCPRQVFMLQAIWRNLLVFAHNALIVLLVLLLFGVHDWRWTPLALPGLVILVLNAAWLATLLGLLAARFRDLPPIVASLLQMVFYVTPILFQREMLGRQRWLADFNPLSHLFDLARLPLLGLAPNRVDWMVSSALAVGGWMLALALNRRYLARLPFWV